MTDRSAAVDPGETLLDLYDTAVIEVFDYLARRCGDRNTAEDLTAEVFMAAVDSIGRGAVADVTVAWLIGIARHKLVDHWRRAERESRRLEAVVDDARTDGWVDPWDVELDVLRARELMAGLAAHHRSALTLRYVDDLPVREVAVVIDRTVHATEALLVRARAAFRRANEGVES